MMTELMRVTRDAELRYLPSGEPVANISLAYNYGSKKDERGYLPTQFIEVGLWGKRAENTVQYFTKGKTILAYVSDVHNETFTKQDGTPGFKMVGRLDNFKFVGGDRQEGEQPRQQSAPRQQQAPASTGFDDMADDIPF
jgi:single-strand DNA-binding protein